MDFAYYVPCIGVSKELIFFFFFFPFYTFQYMLLAFIVNRKKSLRIMKDRSYPILFFFFFIVTSTIFDVQVICLGRIRHCRVHVESSEIKKILFEIARALQTRREFLTLRHLV